MITKKRRFPIQLTAGLLAVSATLSLPPSAIAATNSEDVAPGVSVTITCRNSTFLPFNPAVATVTLDSFTNDGAAGQINYAGLVIGADFEMPQGVNESVNPPAYTVSFTRVFFGGDFPLSSANVSGSFTTDIGNEYALPNRGVSAKCD